jgi:acyl-CoA oxidase
MKPLPGVEVGDIGPKIGFHSKDNGYLILNNVAIPREDMLRRFITVNKNGEVYMKGDPKVGYATMMEIRKLISCVFPKAYSCAITIATRYSLFRRQFKNIAKEEIQIIDYQLQQEKIIDRVAEYYAITLAGNNIHKMCTQNLKNVR